MSKILVRATPFPKGHPSEGEPRVCPINRAHHNQPPHAERGLFIGGHYPLSSSDEPIEVEDSIDVRRRIRAGDLEVVVPDKVEKKPKPKADTTSITDTK